MRVTITVLGSALLAPACLAVAPPAARAEEEPVVEPGKTSARGYKGRIGIYQVLPVTDEMRQLIMRNGNALEIAEQARREGVRDLRQSGLIKVRQGITSLEEVEGVTNE